MSDTDRLIPCTENDRLTNDNPIPGQNFVCLSFISPQKILKQKQIYYNKHFLTHLVTNKLALRNFLGVEKFSDLDDPEYNIAKPTYDNTNERYKDFMFVNENKLQETFNKSVKFQTNVSGVKIRGSYESKEEVNARAETLRSKEPQFDVLTAHVGYWVPYDPDHKNIKNKEYAETQLNTLMYCYEENEKRKDEAFERGVFDQKQAVEKENKKIKSDNNHVDTPELTSERFNELRTILDSKDKILEKTKASVNNSAPLQSVEPKQVNIPINIDSEDESVNVESVNIESVNIESVNDESVNNESVNVKSVNESDENYKKIVSDIF
jgi:hypothetical protein